MEEGNQTARQVTGAIYGIVVHQGIPKLVEIIAVTGKRAKIRRPGASAIGEIKSLPVSEIYEYDEALWQVLAKHVEVIENRKERIQLTVKELKPLMASLQAKAGGVGDDFWS